MKVHAEWWGIVLIPENDEDIAALYRFPPKADTWYSHGAIDWMDCGEQDGGLIKSAHERYMKLMPLDIALVLHI